MVVQCVIRARGCIYSCHTPDDGCKKRPKQVEKSRSEIKVTTRLHRVGLFLMLNFVVHSVTTGLYTSCTIIKQPSYLDDKLG